MEILGGPSALPFGIAPTGFTRLMQTEGEIAGASAAGAAGIPFTLSTLGTTSIEDVKKANPHGRNWFQLYVMNDREISYGLARRAAEAGFDTLQFTVDTPIAGARLRDKRNGFSIPPQLTLGTIVNAIPRPWWWYDFLTTPKLEFASLSSTGGGTVGELLNAAMDPTISYEDLAVIRDLWPGKLVVKGVQNVEDAVRLIDAGVDGIVLSNHGGRQLDRAPIPFHLLPKVVREVGKDATVMIDTGIMNGADIVASIALGAKFTLIGRAYLYGLMAGGRQGVDRTITILQDRDRAHDAPPRRRFARRARAEARDSARATGARRTAGARRSHAACDVGEGRCPHSGGRGKGRQPGAAEHRGARLGAREGGNETIEELGRVLPALDRVAGHAHRQHGVVVAVRVEAVADEEHVLERDAGLLGQPAHAVGLVDALVGDVDRRRAAGADLEVGELLRNSRAKGVLLLAGRIPGGLRVERSVLSERREGDLRPAVLEDVAPCLGLPESQTTSLALHRGESARLLVLGERVGVHLLRRRSA